MAFCFGHSIFGLPFALLTKKILKLWALFLVRSFRDERHICQTGIFVWPCWLLSFRFFELLGCWKVWFLCNLPQFWSQHLQFIIIVCIWVILLVYTFWTFRHFSVSSYIFISHTSVEGLGNMLSIRIE